MISHADSKAAGNPPQHNRYYKGLPGEAKHRRDGADVECSHEGSGQIDLLGERFVVMKDAHNVYSLRDCIQTNLKVIQLDDGARVAGAPLL
jgi:hypothetical protein